MNARVRTNNNEYINLIDVNSTLVVPDCIRRLYSVRQATHKEYKVLLDSYQPGLWVCDHFIPFVNDPETNLWLLPLFPPTSKDNGIDPIPSYSAATLPMPVIDIRDELQELRRQWLMEHHRLGHPSQKRQATLEKFRNSHALHASLLRPGKAIAHLPAPRKTDQQSHGKTSTATSAAKYPRNLPADTNTLWSSYAPIPAPNTSSFLPTRTTSSTRTADWSLN